VTALWEKRIIRRLFALRSSRLRQLFKASPDRGWQRYRASGDTRWALSAGAGRVGVLRFSIDRAIMSDEFFFFDGWLLGPGMNHAGFEVSARKDPCQCVAFRCERYDVNDAFKLPRRCPNQHMGFRIFGRLPSSAGPSEPVLGLGIIHRGGDQAAADKLLCTLPLRVRAGYSYEVLQPLLQSIDRDQPNSEVDLQNAALLVSPLSWPRSGRTAPKQGGVLEGAIDNVFPDGRISGWARNTERPFDPIEIVIKCGEVPIAQGQATSFRKDLLDTNIGHGWYGFNVRPFAGLDWANTSELSLHHEDGQMVGRPFEVRAGANSQTAKTDIQAIGIDDGYAYSIECVRGFVPLIERFVEQHGHVRFVDFAYCYVLGRQADPIGLGHYTSQLSKGAITPFEALTQLYQAEERGGRRLPSPLSPYFPFRE
jgi:hypothetical protein